MPLTLRKKASFLLLFLYLSTTALPQSTGYHARYTPTTIPIYASYEEIATADGGIVMAGVANSAYNQETSNLMVTRLDSYGNVIWGASYNVAGLGYSDPSICAMSDGSVAVAIQVPHSTPSYYADMLVVKLDCQGQVTWSRTLAMKSGNQILEALSLKEGKNGDLILSFYNNAASPLSVVSRIDASGKLVWSKTFYAPTTDPTTFPNTADHYIAAAFYANNAVMVFGLKYEYQNIVNYSKQMYAMQLDYGTGAVTKQQSYNYNEINTGNWGVIVTAPKIHFDAQQLSDGSFALFGLFSNFSTTTAYFFELNVNADLSVKQTKAWGVPKDIGVESHCLMRVLPNGQVHITSADYNTNTFYWYAADASGNTIRQVQIPYGGASMNVYSGTVFQTGPTRVAYALDVVVNTKWSVDVTQVEDGSDAINSCLGSPYTFVQPQSWSANAGTWVWTSTADNELTSADAGLSATNMPLSSSYLCAPGKPVATDFSIVGPASICSAGKAETYKVNTTNASYKPVLWSVDPASAGTLTPIDDESVSIAFADGAPSTVTLYASASSCVPVKTSLTIKIYPKAHLPKSVTVCTQPAMLDPGNWFDAYLWQDGSTSQTYTVTHPGTYIVDLDDHCGGTEKDTVEAYNDRIGGFSVAPLCAGDTVIISAPKGFSNYSWGPDYDLTPVNDTAVKVYPDKDTSYVLLSATPDGCSLKDTIRVDVRALPVVKLGNDTTICQFDVLKLNAGAGFESYSWNTGVANPVVIAAPGNVYSVLVVDGSGCKGSDTIQVMEKYCPDAFFVPNAFTPDGNGHNDIFRPHIEGKLDEYQFTVYNRWGTIVFATNDRDRGWDGRYNGVLQTTGTYAWVCRYKFSDGGKKTLQGIVELLK